MSTLTSPSPSPTPATTLAPATTVHRQRWTSLARAEWTKMRSVRSTMWTIVTMIVITLGIATIAGATIASRWSTFSPAQQATFDPTKISLRGLLFSQLIIGVLGVLVMSAEYGTGTIRASLSAVPRRTRVLVAKVAVFAVVAFVVSEALAFGAFFIGQSLLTSPAPHAVLSQPGVLRAVVGGGLVVSVLGLVALGLATIIRHSAGAITAYVGVLLVAPIILQALPSSVGQPILRYMPFTISDAMTSVTTHSTSAFSPWVGFAVLVVYAVVALGIGGWLLVRRDA
jgi:ABC-type transport system involved in multi-copper enzyme maturation permease subunit